MKIVQVTYTTKIEYAEHNQQNIKNVMAELKNLNQTGIHYHACIFSDNKTFIHTAFFNKDEDQKKFNDLASFKYFQDQLKTGGLEVAPKQELLTLVGSSYSIF
jgi:hypothetical protein